VVDEMAFLVLFARTTSAQSIRFGLENMKEAEGGVCTRPQRWTLDWNFGLVLFHGTPKLWEPSYQGVGRETRLRACS
jgi:hypothetical protein